MSRRVHIVLLAGCVLVGGLHGPRAGALLYGGPDSCAAAGRAVPADLRADLRLDVKAAAPLSAGRVSWSPFRSPFRLAVSRDAAAGRPFTAVVPLVLLEPGS